MEVTAARKTAASNGVCWSSLLAQKPEAAIAILPTGLNFHQMSKEKQRARNQITAAERKVESLEDRLRQIEAALSSPDSRPIIFSPCRMSIAASKPRMTGGHERVGEGRIVCGSAGRGMRGERKQDKGENSGVRASGLPDMQAERTFTNPTDLTNFAAAAQRARTGFLRPGVCERGFAGTARNAARPAHAGLGGRRRIALCETGLTLDAFAALVEQKRAHVPPAHRPGSARGCELRGGESDIDALWQTRQANLAGALNPADTFAVQSRFPGDRPRPYRKFTLNETLSNRLHTTDGRGRWSAKRPLRWSASLCAPTVGYIGISRAASEPQRVAGGRTPFQARRRADQPGGVQAAGSPAMCSAWLCRRDGKALDMGAAPGGWTRVLRRSWACVSWPLTPPTWTPAFAAIRMSRISPQTIEAFLPTRKNPLRSDRQRYADGCRRVGGKNASSEPKPAARKPSHYDAETGSQHGRNTRRMCCVKSGLS